MTLFLSSWMFLRNSGLYLITRKPPEPISGYLGCRLESGELVFPLDLIDGTQGTALQADLWPHTLVLHIEHTHRERKRERRETEREERERENSHQSTGEKH